MSASWHIKRRTFLRGLGTAIALPLLDAMAPSRLWAAGAPAGPKRLAFLFVPNGANMPDWTPAAEGTQFELPSTLAPLADVREHVLVLSGLAQNKANANGDGGGDHARAVATFLTGMQARKTDGKDIRAGVSVDQVAARAVGKATQFPSLEIGCERGSMAGNCDSGYSCAYSSNMSWRTENTPMPKEINPRAVFDRLFSSGDKEESRIAAAERQRYRRSVLDFALDDARRLQQKLGKSDRRKLDEYLAAVRSMEGRIDKASKGGGDLDEKGLPEITRPNGVPSDYAEHIRLMADLMAFAFQCDLTRISTFMLANAGSNRSYRQIDVPEGHHNLSHHGNNADKLAKISKINHFHMEQFSYLLKRLASMKEGDGTVLDNSMIVYGSGIGDGNRHNHDDLPLLLAGRGGGTITSGRHVRCDKTPLMNLYLTLLDRLDVHVDALGDSTGHLEGLQV